MNIIRVLTGLCVLLMTAACGTPAASTATTAPTQTVPATEVTVTIPSLTPTTSSLTLLEAEVTPFGLPVPLPPTPVCPSAPPTRLILQERARVTDDDPGKLRMRENPGTSHAIVALLPINEVVFVLKGPICEEEYAWFQVRWNDKEGWIAEGDENMYFIEPFLPG